MVKLTEENIEQFIRDNKDKFSIYHPPENHIDRFFYKLNYGIRHIMNIVPYLIRLAVATVIIFIASIIIWNNYIRKDRNEVTLGAKISMVIDKLKPQQYH
jgi:hypothetical protein